MTKPFEEPGSLDGADSVRVELPPDRGSLRLLGQEMMRFAAAALGPMGDSREVHDLRLAVQEAVANLFKHETGRPDDAGVVVVFRRLPDFLVAEIRSSGRQFDPTRAPAVLRPPEDLEECGRGLFLINALVDEVRYEFEGVENVLTLFKQLGAKEDAA